MLNHNFLRTNEYAKLLFDLEAALRDSGRTARRGGYHGSGLSSAGSAFRRQPMVVMGSIVGAALFWFQDAPCYPAMEGVSVGAVLLVMLLGCTLLPLPLKWDIRDGWKCIR